MLNRIWMPSPNYSSRGGAGVRLIVLHTAEGARTIESLSSWFAQSSVQASSHVGADDKVNTVGEYVRRDNKAWTQGEFNPVCVSLELCGFAAWSTSEWDQHPNMLDNCAKWIAEEARHYDIPIIRLSASQAQGSSYGVCQHVDLGARGGGHHDCGPGFPMQRVLELAAGGEPIDTVPPTEEDENMIASETSAQGTLHVWWVEKDKRTVKYKWQNPRTTDWKGGGQFTKAGRDIRGLSAALSDTGTLELFANMNDGQQYHTWQRKGESSWSGGQSGKQVADFSPL